MRPTGPIPAPVHPVRYDFAAAPADVDPPPESDGWMVSFVDILMLLLTLFVVLLVVQRTPDPTKPDPASVVAHVSTPSSKTEPTGSPVAPRHAPTPAAANARKPVGHTSNSTATATPRRHAPGPSADFGQQLRNALFNPIDLTVAAAVRSGASPAKPEARPTAQPASAAPAAHLASPATATAFVVPADIRDQVEVARTATKVNLVIKDDVLFDAGSADLKPAGRQVLERVAELLKQSAYPVSVEGHTDNRPIHTARYPSNWELSAARATNVTRFLIQCGVSADRLRAIGYADTRPRAGNDTAAGRARNRRVSLVVHLNEHSSGIAGAGREPAPVSGADSPVAAAPLPPADASR
ncbi:MAG: OmpA family protein [Gammaproteobacteria bacterium]